MFPWGQCLCGKMMFLASAGNVRVQKNNPLGHAELEVLAKAAIRANSWRFDGVELLCNLGTLYHVLRSSSAVSSGKHLLWSLGSPSRGGGNALQHSGRFENALPLQGIPWNS